MSKFIAFLLLFFSSTLYAQYPTDQPKIRTRDVPEHLQDPVLMIIIIVGAALLVFALIYFIRFDKILTRWFRK
jgi:hypothetical protein